MIRFVIISLISFIISCGTYPGSYRPLDERVLRVTEIIPEDGGSATKDQVVTITFSEAVDVESIVSDAVKIAAVNDLQFSINETPNSKDIEEAANMEGALEIDKTYEVISFTPTEHYEEGAEYAIFVTPKIRSQSYLPLGGSSGLENSFISTFIVEGARISDGSGDNDNSHDSENGNHLVNDMTSEPPPEFVYINEILYDIKGSDTKGDVFAELFGEAGGCLDGYYLALVNGDNGEIYKTIPFEANHYINDKGLFVVADTDTDDHSNIIDADMYYNFDPQNGPDSMQLIDPDNNLIDVIGYGKLNISHDSNGLPLYKGSPSEDAPSGSSLSRIKDAEITNDNSIDFVINSKPSAGNFEVVY